MIDTRLDAEMEGWENASENDCGNIASVTNPIDNVKFDTVSYIVGYERLEKAINAAIKKLDGPGMPHRSREAIAILREAVDED